MQLLVKKLNRGIFTRAPTAKALPYVVTATPKAQGNYLFLPKQQCFEKLFPSRKGGMSCATTLVKWS